MDPYYSYFCPSIQTRTQTDANYVTLLLLHVFETCGSVNKARFFKNHYQVTLVIQKSITIIQKSYW